MPAVSMTASVSRRAFIQWLPDKPSEPTSTLVLTSATGRFVDIRIKKEALQVDNEPVRLTNDQLDWAFAGQSVDTPLDHDRISPPANSDLAQYASFTSTGQVKQSDEMSQYCHTTWKHSTDSRAGNADSIVDQGDMYYHAGLDMTLEQGAMAHPETGKITNYNEGWLSEPMLETDGMPNCIVFELVESAEDGMGTMIKLGSYIQGVARLGSDFSLIRSEWSPGVGWRVKATMGHPDFPNPSMIADARLGELYVVSDKDGFLMTHWKTIEVAYMPLVTVQD